MLHFRLNLFKSAYRGERRALMQPGGKLIQLGRRADGVSLHSAIVQISHPARQTERATVLFHEGPVADALNSARNQPPPGGLPVVTWLCLQ